MERRRFLGLVAALSASIGSAGCLTWTNSVNNESDSETESSPEENLESNAENETETPEYDCPRLGHLEVYVAPDVPDEKPVLDAEADGLTDSQHVSTALAAASEEYEPGMEDEIDPSERTDPDNRLARIDSEELAASDEAIEKLEYGEPSYVEYEGVTYLLLYVESVC